MSLIQHTPVRHRDDYSVETVDFLERHALKAFRSHGVGDHATVYLHDVSEVDIGPITSMVDESIKDERHWQFVCITVRTETGNVTLHLIGKPGDILAPPIKVALKGG